MNKHGFTCVCERERERKSFAHLQNVDNMLSVGVVVRFYMKDYMAPYFF